MAYTYIVRCADGTLYTGWTTDTTARLAAHNAGRASRYTRARLPVTLVYSECYPDQTSARKREAAIKKLNKREKEELIAIQKATDMV